uniref:SGNH hydrolase-type esterase domain-containing protein n=1 Tax=Cacopsylla melanoneura TaxID=428564 RepID=A0A8D8QDS2_9HEMI
MVLTRTQINFIEEKTGKQLLLSKVLSEDVKNVTITIYTELLKMFDSHKEEVLTRNFLNTIALILERLEEESQGHTSSENKYSKVLAENTKFRKEIQTLKETYATQKKINDSLAEDVELTDQETKKLSEENTHKIRSLEKNLESRAQEIVSLRKANKDLIETAQKKLKSKDNEIRQVQDSLEKVKKENKQLKEEKEAAEKKGPEKEANSTINKNMLVQTTTQATASVAAQESVTSSPSTSTGNQRASPPPSSAMIENDRKSNLDRLFVIGDSHTRDLQSIFQNAIQPDFSAKTICMPGKTLAHVVDAIKPDKLTSNSLVCIVAGTNDVFKTNWNDTQATLDKLYRKCKNNEILIVLAPPRYNIRKINKHIINMNVKIKHYIKKYSNMSWLDPHNFITIQDMSSDMTHLTRRGKFILCSKIVARVFGITMKLDNHSLYNTNKSALDSHSHYTHTHNSYMHSRHNGQVNEYFGFRHRGNLGTHQYQNNMSSQQYQHHIHNRRNTHVSRNTRVNNIQGSAEETDQGYNKLFPPLQTQRRLQTYNQAYNDPSYPPYAFNPNQTNNRFEIFQTYGQNFRPFTKRYR